AAQRCEPARRAPQRLGLARASRGARRGGQASRPGLGRAGAACRGRPRARDPAPRRLRRRADRRAGLPQRRARHAALRRGRARDRCRRRARDARGACRRLLGPRGRGARRPRADRGVRPMTGWAADLALGVRLGVSGGRSGWVRLALISLGVGLGVAMLLVAASAPAVLDARADRAAARWVDSDQVIEPGTPTLLTTPVRSMHRGGAIEGRLPQPEPPDAALPPGVDRQLAPGEVVLSPALERLLASPDGAALRGRWGDVTVGTIGPEGLTGPGELTFYLGTDRLTDETAVRISSFGGDQEPDGGTSPVMVLLALVGIVVLLLPVGIFVATAVRFGSEARDQRLAALRLVGADARTTRRVAAGETLTGAVLGLGVGALLWLLVSRVAGTLVPGALSFFPADVRPSPALVVL